MIIQVPNKEFIRVKNYFMDQYEGVTITGPSQGYWSHSKLEYRDETVEYFVLVSGQKFLKQIKPDLIKQINRGSGQD